MIAFTFATLIALLPSGALGAEWVTISDRAAGVAEDDGATLAVTCDHQNGRRTLHSDARGQVSISFSEPRASWNENSEIEILIVSDDSSRTTVRAHGISLTSTDLQFKNDAKSELRVMGQAKTSFMITAGGYTRELSAIKLRETVGSVLNKCGDHW